MPSPEILKLVHQLQMAAYNNGYIDRVDHHSDKKYRDAADKSDAAFQALLLAIDKVT